MPMNRGILETIYVRLAAGATLGDLRAVLEAAYRDEPFVRVLPEGSLPATRHVRATNLCLIGLSHDRVAHRAILVSAIDNLVKGASGQAIQNMNAMLGLPEITRARAPRPIPVTERRRAASVSREAGSGSPCAGLSRVSSSFVVLLVLAIGSAAPAAAADVAVAARERCSSKSRSIPPAAGSMCSRHRSTRARTAGTTPRTQT